MSLPSAIVRRGSRISLSPLLSAAASSSQSVSATPRAISASSSSSIATPARTTCSVLQRRGQATAAAAVNTTVASPVPPPVAAPSAAPVASAAAFGTVPTFVTADWVDRNIGLVVPIDATYHLPNANRNAFEEYRKCHLKNARFFNIDTVSSPSPTGLPHMLPTAEIFSQHMGQLGISDTDHVVIYDTHGLFSAPRAWWTFKMFGHAKVSILEGGLPNWVKEERAVYDSDVKTKAKFYKAKKPDPTMTRTFVQMVANSNKADQNPKEAEQVIDARPEDRFNGEAPEPRKGVPSGHMPFSANLPAALLVDPVTKALISKDKLVALLRERGIDPNVPTVATCGSGVSACLVLLALHERLGVPMEKLSLYDGSWAEWGTSEGKGAVIVSRGPKVQVTGKWL